MCNTTMKYKETGSNAQVFYTLGKIISNNALKNIFWHDKELM